MSVIAQIQARSDRLASEARDRFIAFGLTSIDHDGFPRVSGYACDVWERDGLITRTGVDTSPYCLTQAGRDRLAEIETNAHG